MTRPSPPETLTTVELMERIAARDPHPGMMEMFPCEKCRENAALRSRAKRLRALVETGEIRGGDYDLINAPDTR